MRDSSESCWLFHVHQKFVNEFQPSPRPWDALLASSVPPPAAAAITPELSTSVSNWMVDAVANQEGQAERSLMHRYDTAQKASDTAWDDDLMPISASGPLSFSFHLSTEPRRSVFISLWNKPAKPRILLKL